MKKRENQRRREREFNKFQERNNKFQDRRDDRKEKNNSRRKIYIDDSKDQNLPSEWQDTS